MIDIQREHIVRQLDMARHARSQLSRAYLALAISGAINGAGLIWLIWRSL